MCCWVATGSLLCYAGEHGVAKEGVVTRQPHWRRRLGVALRLSLQREDYTRKQNTTHKKVASPFSSTCYSVGIVGFSRKEALPRATTDNETVCGFTFLCTASLQHTAKRSNRLILYSIFEYQRDLPTRLPLGKLPSRERRLMRPGWLGVYTIGTDPLESGAKLPQQERDSSRPSDQALGQ